MLADRGETSCVFPVVGLRRSGFPQIDFEIVRMFQDEDVTFIQAAHLSGAREAAWGSMSFVFKPGDKYPQGHCCQVTVISADRARPDRSMAAGSRVFCDYELNDANKALVTEFTRAVLIGKRIDRLSEFVSRDKFISYNERIGVGYNALEVFFRSQMVEPKVFDYTKFVQVIGKGNFVAVMTELIFRDEPYNACDLYRIEAGRIVEHWDTVERQEDVPRPSNDTYEPSS